MDARVFVELVQKMMDAKARFFKDRKIGDLIESKNIERDVRKALKEGIEFGDALTPGPSPEGRGEQETQQTLFTEVDHEAQAE